jgi:hypothetical protein
VTQIETTRLAKELCQRWKHKFSAQDLEYWAEQLDGYDIESVVTALTAFKNSSRFVPKIHEIKAALNSSRDSVRVQVKRRDDDGGLVGCLRNTHPWLRNETSSAAVILRYWRQLWMVQWGRISLVLNSLPDDALNATHRNQLYERGQAICKRIQRDCARGLLGVMDQDRAMRCVAFIPDTPEMFRLLLDELHADEVLDNPPDESPLPFDSPDTTQIFQPMPRPADSSSYKQLEHLAQVHHAETTSHDQEVA